MFLQGMDGSGSSYTSLSQAMIQCKKKVRTLWYYTLSRLEIDIIDVQWPYGDSFARFYLILDDFGGVENLLCFIHGTCCFWCGRSCDSCVNNILHGYLTRIDQLWFAFVRWLMKHDTCGKRMLQSFFRCCAV